MIPEVDTPHDDDDPNGFKFNQIYVESNLWKKQNKSYADILKTSQIKFQRQM